MLFECQRRHLNVPGKLAIAGFDDLDGARLSSCADFGQDPHHQMGRRRRS